MYMTRMNEQVNIIPCIMDVETKFEQIGSKLLCEFEKLEQVNSKENFMQVLIPNRVKINTLYKSKCC